jgi:hypothetical protein
MATMDENEKALAETFLDTLAEALEAAAPGPEASYEDPAMADVALSNGLMCLVQDTWMPVEVQVWRSWTGRRAIFGMEYHGPVYSMNSPDDSEPFDGRRACSCDSCQLHVAPEKRPN